VHQHDATVGVLQTPLLVVQMQPVDVDNAHEPT
jgi:hypothetical protein